MSDSFIGLQTGGISVLVNGADFVCDFIKDEGGVNALCLGSHGGSYAGGDDQLQGWVDQGAPKMHMPDKPLPSAMVPIREKYYQNTFLRHARDPEKHSFCDRDVLEESVSAAHKRGMKLIARSLEVFHPIQLKTIDGLAQVTQKDVYDRRVSAPCWNHPAYRAWWLGMTEEIFKEYEVDGLLLGPERDAPLGPILYNAASPTCFCNHCQAEATTRGIDIKQARAGMKALHQMILRVKVNQLPRDGILTEVMRLWIKYPEILAWEKMQNDAKWSLHREIYGLGKTLRPESQIGWMVPVYPIKHDIFSRAAAYDYAEMSEFSDFIKPNIYQDVNCARLRDWVDNRPYMYRDLSPQQLHELLYSLFGIPGEEPAHADAADKPFGAAFIKAEVERCKAGCVGDTQCYAGIGVDIPHGNIKGMSYDEQYEQTKAAWDAGTDGILLSRELQFMTKETLNATRDASIAAGAIEKRKAS